MNPNLESSPEAREVSSLISNRFHFTANTNNPGIGAAVAQRLATKGCNLLLVFTSDSSVKPTKALCEQLASTHSIYCASIQADLSSPVEASSSILEAAKTLFHSYNPSSPFQIDILINNAGVSSNQRLNDPNQGPISITEFDRVYKINVVAPLLLTQTIAPYLPTDRSGRIVTVSSVSSSIGYQGQSVYAGSKAAVEAMTRVWSRELAERATVNAVNPGPAWGDMYEKAGQTFWDINQPYVDAAPLAQYNGEKAVLEMAGEDAERFDRLVRENMKGRRPAFTAEIAGTIDMLCSSEAGWTTGSVICANGGMKMSIA
ncbi:L-xylo-3-hexulose reductase [Penicillium rolfsii]|nr:L-xylo-3-hexulose reductase [Penicillium rolfsii]